MTMLREEIEKYLGSCGCIWTVKPVYTDEILELFEKIIDEKIGNIKPIAYSLDTLTVTDWVIKELEELKEELKK